MNSGKLENGFFLYLLMATAVGCTKADFKSESRKQITSEAATLTCSTDHKYSEDDLRVGVRGEKNARIIVNGEFCPQAPARLNIVFLIDFSLSMFNEQKDRGNDQVKNGSCGRLDAAKAIIKSHKENAASLDAKVSVGVVQFASKLEGTIEPTELDAFEDELTTENFCRGISGTNYKAAFEAATAMLKDVNGSKVVYLISDGLPTEGGGGKQENAPRHRDAAQKAADEMRSAVSLLTYNTIYLLNDFEIEDDSFDPVEFLETLTGTPKRVKLVEKAEDLASEIVKLEKPPVEIDTDKVTATLTAKGAADIDVPVSLFKPHETKPETWVFATDEFDAFPGSDESSRLQISAVDVNGETYQLTLKFEPGDETKPIDDMGNTP